MNQEIEIMAPVGSFESLHAAIEAGADSVYFGVDYLNMRARASNNFTINNLQEIVSICAAINIKTYVTLNTIIYDEDISCMQRICDAVKASKVSAIIASDMSVINYARSINQNIHLSTQVNVCNIEAVRFYSKYADVIVLARELTLDQIKNICLSIYKENIIGPSGNLVKIEIFIHGALCVAIAGKCYMSLAQYNSSANRGACLQACRRSYRVIDEETNNELSIDNQYIMSPKDLCTIGFLDKILEAGVSILKIEGRGRSPDYVYKVTKTYKDALNGIMSGSFTQENIDKWIQELKSVYNRGFWHGGYYLGKKLGEWSDSYGSQATEKKVYIGKATNYFNNIKVAEFKLETQSLKKGDKILITGPTTGVIFSVIRSIRTHQGIQADKGDIVTFLLPQKIRKNDKLYLMVDKK